MVDIVPGILEKEWPPIEEKLKLVSSLTELAQIDVADNTLVPNTTFLDFPKFASITKPSLEAHLMVASPEKYIKPLADAGFKRLIAHVECQDPRLFLDQVQYEHVDAGIAIDGPTGLEEVEPFLEEVDLVLVMTIEAGFSGQPFLEETLEKIKKIRTNFPDLPIEVDGGINDKTAPMVIAAGATRLVSTSYLFKDPTRIEAAIERLK